MDLGFQILYDQGPCLAVCKPPGVATQAPPGIDSLEARIKAFLRVRGNRPEGKMYLGIPHRLDRPASGAIVFGLHSRAAHRLSKQFERRQVEKIYWACVEGRVESEAGTWRDCVRKIPDVARGEVVTADHPDARSAVLQYRVLGYFDWGSWLEIQLETGRMHQVRLQAATRGHPLLGDAMYGSTVPFGTQYADERARAIALHARSLRFQHPMSKEIVTVVAPVTDDWRAFGLTIE